MATVEIRSLRDADPDPMAAAFAAIGRLGKNVAQYRRYLAEQEAGTRAVFVAGARGGFAGYLTVVWSSGYAPFGVAGIPEIVDLNVLPSFRRRGIGGALLDAAEELIGTRSDTAGIGVGLTAGYAAAHRMYLRRGYLPDGRGLAYWGVPCRPGASVRVGDDLALMMTRALR